MSESLVQLTNSDSKQSQLTSVVEPKLNQTINVAEKSARELESVKVAKAEAAMKMAGICTCLATAPSEARYCSSVLYFAS
eukprot:SAG31_NODE_2373_length_5846_cov_1.932313_3_plen_80_part_00